MSRKKRKNKVTRLTEQDYNNYIMSLKDERPAEPIHKVCDKYEDTGA